MTVIIPEFTMELKRSITWWHQSHHNVIVYALHYL